MCGYYETRWYYESNVELELGFTNQVSFTSKSHNANTSHNTPTYYDTCLQYIISCSYDMMPLWALLRIFYDIDSATDQGSWRRYFTSEVEGRDLCQKRKGWELTVSGIVTTPPVWEGRCQTTCLHALGPHPSASWPRSVIHAYRRSDYELISYCFTCPDDGCSIVAETCRLQLPQMDLISTTCSFSLYTYHLWV